MTPATTATTLSTAATTLPAATMLCMCRRHADEDGYRSGQRTFLKES